MKTQTTQVIEVPAINPQYCTVKIVGDSDLVLNKIDNATKRFLETERDGNKPKKIEKVNKWEKICTSIHWLYGDPDLAPEDYTEDTMKQLLKENVPCISAFGFKKQLNKAVVRYGVATYSTGFDANVKTTAPNGLIPVKFTEHFIDEDIRQPKKGAPVLSRTNRFSGWSADVGIAFLEGIISLESVLNVFNLMGYNIGIGSGVTSGFGRFHVENVT